MNTPTTKREDTKEHKTRPFTLGRTSPQHISAGSVPFGPARHSQVYVRPRSLLSTSGYATPTLGVIVDAEDQDRAESVRFSDTALREGRETGRSGQQSQSGKRLAHSAGKVRQESQAAKRHAQHAKRVRQLAANR